ncbi:helix-turn-helix domain-containing protein [Monashia sp. NPDC004114]
MSTDWRVSEARRIVGARMEKGWSQGRLAKEAGVGLGTVYSIEKAKPVRAATLLIVRGALDLGDTDVPPESDLPSDVRLVVEAVALWLHELPEPERARAVSRLLAAISTPQE